MVRKIKGWSWRFICDVDNEMAVCPDCQQDLEFGEVVAAYMNKCQAEDFKILLFDDIHRECEALVLNALPGKDYEEVPE